jgi:ubiquinone/menaquinone biosynthesis C-methylase UbiE
MTSAFFNARADIWDEAVAEKDAKKLEAMVERFGIRPGSTVLDVGTGTGVFLPFLLGKIGEEGRLVCVDFAGDMLKKAQEKGFNGNIQYLCSDIENTGLEDECYDAVVCYSSFPHFVDKPRALGEIHRMLKRGGRLFICHTSSREHINEIHRQMPEVHDHLIPEADEMQELFSRAKFTEISIEETVEDYLASARKAS